MKPKKNIDLIGHSFGGLMLRLFLSDQLFNNDICNAKSISKNLITLGIPHKAIKVNELRQFIDDQYPFNFFENINYVSVGGEI